MKKNLFLTKEIIEKGFSMPFINPGTSFPETVIIVLEAISKHLEESENIKNFLKKTKKGPGTNCPDSPIEELVKYLAEQNGQIDKTDPIVNLKFMEDFVFPVFNFERDCLKKIVFFNKDNSQKEINLFLISLSLCGLIDKLYCRWFQKIVVSYHSLNDNEKILYQDTLKEQLASCDYTVFDCIGVQSVANRQTWAAAFPEEINSIVAVLKNSKTLDDEIISQYFLALANAYACREISQLENLWSEVDKAWIKIPSDCRLFPVHGMENYEHPFGVSPEFRLVIKLNEEKKVIEQTRKTSSEFALKIGVKEELTKIADEKMKNIDFGVYVTTLRAGCNANFRITGQVVPNRQEILINGGKIFIDLESLKNGVNNYKRLLTKYCEPDKKDLFINMMTVNGLMSQVLSHECSHPIGCTPESDAQLGEKKSLLEEAKATCGGLANILENSCCERKMELLVFSVARICKFFISETYKNNTVKAYVRENMVMANLILKADLVEITKKGIKIKLSKEGLEKWRLSLEKFYVDIIKSYHSSNPVKKIIEKENFYCKITPDIKKWLELVNK